MNVTVIGTGYVGLVTGACLAEIGHQVICVDNNRDKVTALQAGKIPIYEPGLESIVCRHTYGSVDRSVGHEPTSTSVESISSGSIQFTTDLNRGIEFGDIIFITVGTPALPSGDPNLQYVEAVARGIGQGLVRTQTRSRYRVVVNKSTVPIGSGDWVRMMILDGAAQAAKEELLVGSSVLVGSHGNPRRFDLESVLPHFDVVSNPEFLREGSAIWDTFHPDRIVIGSDSATAVAIMRQLYEPIINHSWDPEATTAAQLPVPFLVTDLASAEMVKYAANAFLATKISFINEVATICERVGADVTEVARGIGLDSRIGPKFLNAGIGWGGSCFPKDVSALVRTGTDYHCATPILAAVIETNHQQRLRVVEKLQQELKVLKGKTIGLLGLTFKPNTDDMRDAPSLTVIEQLLKLGAKVKAYDPIIQSNQGSLAGVQLEQDALSLAQGCDALVLVTEWPEFTNVDFQRLAAGMRRALIVDGRNFFSPQQMRQAGFTYIGMGR
ncbi:MAG: UDP-glucose/GDP-mannose dehydrogenase family protein [Thermostichus sp. DG02_5_bins_236]